MVRNMQRRAGRRQLLRGSECGQKEAEEQSESDPEVLAATGFELACALGPAVLGR